MRVRHLLLASAAALAVLPGLAWAQATREFSIATFENAEPLVRPMAQVVARAYARLGIAINVVRRPITRSIQEADAGLFDAELARTDEIDPDIRNLLRVPEPVGEILYVAFVLKGTAVKFSDWASLKASGMSVGVRFGVRLPEARLGTTLKERPLNQESLLRMLMARRVEVAIGVAETMRAELARLQAAGVAEAQQIVELPPLDRQNLYHYVHNRHAALVPQLAVELKKMQRDGSIKKIWDEASREAP